MGFTIPEYMFRSGSAPLALWVLAHISWSKFGSMQSVWSADASSDDGFLPPFFFRREPVWLPEFVDVVTAGVPVPSVQVVHDFTSSDNARRRPRRSINPFLVFGRILPWPFGFAMDVGHSSLQVDEGRDLVHILPAVFFIWGRSSNKLLDVIVTTSFS